MSIGSFDTEGEAKACYKYICSKFSRAMLGVLKTTQAHKQFSFIACVPCLQFSYTVNLIYKNVKPVSSLKCGYFRLLYSNLLRKSRQSRQKRRTTINHSAMIDPVGRIDCSRGSILH